VRLQDFLRRQGGRTRPWAPVALFTLAFFGFGMAAGAGESALAPWCNTPPHPYYLIMAILAAFIAACLGGERLGAFLRAFIPKKGGGDLTVNLESQIGPGGHSCPIVQAGGLPINPDNCPDCKAEKERSLRNEKHVGELFEKFDDLKDDLNGGIQKLSGEIGAMKTEIIRALAGRT
jgi:hypothetical protein